MTTRQNERISVFSGSPTVAFEGGCLAYPENMNEGKLLDLVLKGLENL